MVISRSARVLRTGLDLVRALAFAGVCALLTGSSNCNDNVGKTETGPTSFRLSIATHMVPANGASTSPSWVTDGRSVCYASRANNLAAPTSGFQELFLRDRQLDTNVNLTKLSLLAAPATAGDCSNPYMTANGNFVVFESKGEIALQAGKIATANPTVSKLFVMNITDLFVNGSITITALYNPVGNSGSTWDPNADCTNATITEDGRFVCFQTSSTVPGITNAGSFQAVYVMDLAAVTFPIPTLVSPQMGSPATAAQVDCTFPKISGNGSTVVFHSLAGTGVLTADANPIRPADTVPNRRIYSVSKTGTGMQVACRSTDGITTTPGPPLDNHCGFPSISQDGRYITFYYQGDQTLSLVAGSKGKACVIRRDTVAGVTDLVATDAFIFAFFISYGASGIPSISDDGQYVAYSGISSSGTDIQIRVRNMNGGTIGASHHILVPGANLNTIPAAIISGDGRWVAWESDSPLEVVGDTNGVTDCFGFGAIH